MKKTMLFVMTLILMASQCQPEVVETVVDQFATLVGTRSDAPLVGTVWECETDGKYNVYLLFEDAGVVSTFWGRTDEEEGLQRWSDFYPGTYMVDKGEISIDVSYPAWGETEKLNSIGMLRVEDAFTLDSPSGLFRYYGKDIEGLEAIWMTLFVDIMPWN